MSPRDIPTLRSWRVSRELEQAHTRAKDAAEAVRAAIANARVELTEPRLLAIETWNLLDVLTDQLIARLGELERIERAECLR